MSEKPEHYTPQYMNNTKNPFNPGYGYGAAGAQQVVVVNAKSVVIAYVLWFFLGYLGIHKFYLRQPFMGIFYLILQGIGWLTTPIFIGWLFLGLWALLWLLDAFTMPIRISIMNSFATRRAY